MAASGGGGGSSSLLGSATTWPLKRYGRFLPPAEGDDEGQNTSSWKVFESNEESGHLVLTIVVSGHFFISQGRAVLEYGIDELTASCLSGYPSYKTRHLAHVCREDKLNVLGQVFEEQRLWNVSSEAARIVKQKSDADCAEKGCMDSDADNCIGIKITVMIEQEPSSHPKNVNMIILGESQGASVLRWRVHFTRAKLNLFSCQQALRYADNTAGGCFLESPAKNRNYRIKSVNSQGSAGIILVYCWSTALRFLFDLATLNYFYLAIRNHPKEGFSLIDSHKWLKIVRRADCLLLRAHSKNECRLFRVQFGGDSKEQMLERCCSCVQKLAEYVPVQVADEQSQQLYHSLHPLGNSENQEQDTEQNTSVLLMPDEPLPDSCTSLGERRSVTQLAQCVLKQPAELSLAAQRSVWRAEELGPFIRLCLMDQNFPAFVEDVEKELRKLAEG